MKKIDITEEQAEKIEFAISDVLNGDAKSNEVVALLKKAKVPKDTVKAFFGRIDGIFSDIQALKGGNIERMFVDDVAEELRRLEQLLDKTFKVARTRTKKAYIWSVWS